MSSRYHGPCAVLMWLLASCAQGPPPSTAASPTAWPPSSEPACVLAGPIHQAPGIYGTDLGLTVSTKGGRQLILFGDTWGEAGDACAYTPEHDDDLLGWLPEQRPATLPISPLSPQPCRVLRYDLEDRNDVRTWSRSRLYGRRPGSKRAGAPLPMGFLRTPVAAFEAHGHAYGVFHRNEPLACRETAACPDGVACTTGLPHVRIGMCERPAFAPEGGAQTFCTHSDDCLLGDCVLPDGGYCLSQSPFKVRTGAGDFVPSWYRDAPRRGLLRVLRIGRMERARPGDFIEVARFATNRFVNPVARAVAHFDPEHPERNDYRPGDHTLLMWGRPAFIGGEFQSLPFLLYQPLPHGPGEALAWAPRFYAGLGTQGRPRWSAREEDAQPVYGGQAAVVLRAQTRRFQWQAPEFDYVNQMTVTFLPEQGRWLMLYGGDAPDFMVSGTGARPRPTHAQPVEGAIHLRHARHPWGGSAPGEAWSAPAPLFTRRQGAPYLACPKRNRAAMPGCMLRVDPHGPFDLLGTLLDHAVSLKPGPFFEVLGQCLAGDIALDVQHDLSGDHIGRMYAPNVIEPWTEVSDAGVVLWWNVSTWSPYQVILVRSELPNALLGLP